MFVRLFNEAANLGMLLSLQHSRRSRVAPGFDVNYELLKQAHSIS